MRWLITALIMANLVPNSVASTVDYVERGGAVCVFQFADSHYELQNADYGNPNVRLVDAMLSLPGTIHPLGGVVPTPDAVFGVGDIVHEDNGTMAAFESDFRWDGKGRIPWPTYILDGNHDQARVRNHIIARHGSLTWGVKVGPVYFQALTENYTSPSVNTPPTAAQINGAITTALARRPVGEPTVMLIHRAFGGYEVEWASDAMNSLETLCNARNTLCILNGHDHYSRHNTWRGIRVFGPGSITQSPQTGPVYSTVYEEAFNVIRIGKNWVDVANYNFGFNLQRPLSGGVVGGAGWAPGTWNWAERFSYAA